MNTFCICRILNASEAASARVLRIPRFVKMQLRPSIRVIPNALTLDGALKLSSGTAPVCQSDERGLRYMPGAMVPTAEWRAPSDAESELLIGWPESDEPGCWLALVRLPEEAIASLRTAVFRPDNAELGDEARAASGASGREAAIARFGHFVREEFGLRSGDDSRAELWGGIRTNDPQMLTVTTHPETGRLVGLHVDDWYADKLEWRHRSPNRISVNLGAGDRFLLFVNLAILEIAHLVGHEQDVESRPGCSDLGRRFLAVNPGYPVVKLRVRPGEAYIAPTENMVHDGTTMGMTAADVALALHGPITLLEPELRRRRQTSMLMHLE